MMYGHKWTSGYGDCDDGTWLAGLQGITLEQIGEGITKCRDSKEEWPPTLNQFRNYCRNEQIGLTHNTAAYKVIPKSHRLEQKADKEKGLRECRKLKEMLK